MRILVVAATEAEVSQLISDLRFTNYDFKEEDTLRRDAEIVIRKSEIVNLNYNCSILITGVGMEATAFALSRQAFSNE